MDIWDLLSLNPIVVYRSRSIDRQATRELLQKGHNYGTAHFWTCLDLQPAALAAQIVERLAQTAQGRGLYVMEGLLSAMALLNSIEKLQIQQALLEAHINLSKNIRLVLLDHSAGAGAVVPPALQEILPEYIPAFPAPEQVEEIWATKNLGCDERLVASCRGLTATELQVGIEMAVNAGCSLDDLGTALLDFRTNLLRLEGLEFLNVPATLEIGGMDVLQESLERVAAHFSPAARAANIPYPSGWLLVGPPGTGKTYTAKAVARRLFFPLVNIGIDNILSKGLESAAYLKRILKRLEAIGEVVVYFDELDKFFPGGVQAASESSMQVLGVLLTWLQDKDAPVFVIGTLNRLEYLPPELTRIGRFDEIWYLGFPQPIERLAILFLHLETYDRRYRADPQLLRENRIPELFPLSINECETIASRLLNYTGAEIEQVANIAYSYAWRQSGQPFSCPQVDLEHILHGIDMVVPIYSRSNESVLAMINRSRGFARNSSTIGLSAFQGKSEDPFTIDRSRS